MKLTMPPRGGGGGLSRHGRSMHYSLLPTQISGGKCGLLWPLSAGIVKRSRSGDRGLPVDTSVLTTGVSKQQRK